MAPLLGLNYRRHPVKRQEFADQSRMNLFKRGSSPSFFVSPTLAAWLLSSVFLGHLILPNIGGMGLALPFNAIWWIAVITTIAAAALGSESITFPRRHGDIILVFAVASLIVPVFFDPMNAVTHGPLYGLLGGFLFLVSLRTASVPANSILLLIIAYGALEALLGLGQAFGITPSPWGKTIPVGTRPMGVFQQPNVLASFLATALAASALFLSRTFTDEAQALSASRGAGNKQIDPLESPGPRQWSSCFSSPLIYIWLGILPICACLVVIASRTGWAAFAIVATGTLLLPWQSDPPGKRLFLLLMILGSSLGLLITQHISELSKLVDRKTQLASARWDFYPDVVRLVIDKFPRGCGYGNFEACYVNTVSTFPDATVFSGLSHPHNEILLWAAEGGLFAIVGMGLAFFCFIRLLKALAIHKRWGLLVLASPILLHAMLEFPFHHSVPHWLALISVLYLAQEHGRSEERTDTITLPPKIRRSVALTCLVISIPSLLHTIGTNSVLWGIRNNFNENARYLKYVGHPGFLKQHYEFELNRHLFLFGVSGREKTSAKYFLEWALIQIERTPRVSLIHDAARAALFLGETSLANDLVMKSAKLFPQLDHSKVLSLEK